MMLTGLGHDTVLNSILFIAGVLPSHVHGFYITCTYFHRRKRARKGLYPGGRRAMIYSKDTLNGGLSSAETERRRQAELWGRGKSYRTSRSKSNVNASRRHSRRSGQQEDLPDLGRPTSQRDSRQQRQDMVTTNEEPYRRNIQAWRGRVTLHDDEMAPVLPPRPEIR
jgi:hypothetical protein